MLHGSYVGFMCICRRYLKIWLLELLNHHGVVSLPCIPFCFHLSTYQSIFILLWALCTHVLSLFSSVGNYNTELSVSLFDFNVKILFPAGSPSTKLKTSHEKITSTFDIVLLVSPRFSIHHTIPERFPLLSSVCFYFISSWSKLGKISSKWIYLYKTLKIMWN